MAIWVGKQKMSCRSCIKGHRSSTCNHYGGPLWAVRPAGRPNKACIHGPGDLCLCAHYFPLTWLKAAVPRRQKCSCQGSGPGRSKCQCGPGNAAAAAAASTTPDDETQPIFYQDLVARGLQVTTEPVDFDVSAPAPSSCCSAPAPVQAPAPPPPVVKSCCSGGAKRTPPIPQAPAPAPSSSCCSGGSSGATSGSATPNIVRVKTEPITSAPFTPVQSYQPIADFPVMKYSPVSPGANGITPVDHVCNCGPTCNCVLCIDHPYNTATMNHIATEFGQMMSNPAGVPQRFSPQECTSPSTPNGRPDLSWQGWNGMMPPGFTDASFVNGQPHQSNSPPPQASDMDIILNPADFQMFNFAWPPPEGEHDHHYQQQQQLHQQQPHFDDMSGLPNMPDFMDLNGFCGGATEVCPCGDDCACIGCQIHKPTNGHGVVPGWV